MPYGSTIMFATASSGMPSATGSERCDAARALDEHFVELAVIRAVEHDDAIAAGHGARDAHRRHHRFRAGVAERHALVAGQLAEQLGDLAGEFASAARSRSRAAAASSTASTTKSGAWPKAV